MTRTWIEQCHARFCPQLCNDPAASSTVCCSWCSTKMGLAFPSKARTADCSTMKAMKCRNV